MKTRLLTSVAFLALLLPASLSAQTVTVMNLTDSDPGSLRDAIDNATPGTTIQFAIGLSGQTIQLTSAKLTISKDLTIDASSLPAKITISGDATGDGPSTDDLQVFHLPFASHTVVFDSLIISGGRETTVTASGGGGIENGVNLTIRDSIISGNRVVTTGDGGGIFNSGTLMIENSTISGNHSDLSGGGIVNSNGGTLIIENSAIINNDADSFGGGITNRSVSMLTIRNSTMSGNDAVNGGGAISNVGGGPTSPIAVIENSTITGNTANLAGGIIISGSAGTTVTLSDTIVAGNTANSTTAPDIHKTNGILNRTGKNLIGDNETVSTEFPTSPSPGQANANGDLVGDTASPLDPVLDALANNGGPTQNHLPLTGSPAINPPGGAAASSLATDQRGFTRVVGGILDIGAVETDVAPMPVPPSSAGSVALRKSLLAKVKKTKKAIKKAKRKNQTPKVKRLTKKLKRFQKRLRAL